MVTRAKPIRHSFSRVCQVTYITRAYGCSVRKASGRDLPIMANLEQVLEGLSPYYTMRFFYFVQVINANVNEMYMQRK